jgi:type VI secretion system protein ImpH
LLGDRISDRNAKITVHLGPLSQYDFDHIVNDKTQWGIIESLIKVYLVTPMEVDIKISLLSNAAQGVSLGQSQWCQLGYDTWLLNQPANKQTHQTTELLVSTLRLQ